MCRQLSLFLLLLFVSLSTASGDELPTLLFDDVVVNEGEAVTLQLRLSAPSSHPVRLTASTRFGNAISGRDFASKSQRITFAPGVTEMSVSFQTKEDDIDEPDQFFWVFFRNPQRVDLVSNRARVTIRDNDAEPTIRFDRTVQSFVEGTNGGITKANIRVRLSHRSEKKIRFTVHTAPNTATELEFSPVAQRVLFQSAGIVFNYVVNLVPDSDLEGRQQFYLYMRNPSNAELVLDDPEADRIRTTIRILDDDHLVIPAPIDPASSFAWIGTFGRRFTDAELDAIATNTKFVVLAKFHAFFDIETHNEETELLRQRNSELKVLPYFNAKHWFVESRWGTTPDEDWLLKDAGGNLVRISTDRSDANYYDLRNPECRAWILATIALWLDTGLYDGIAFDSAGPIGDYGEATFWQDLLGGQTEIDAWNAGLASLLQDTKTLLNSQGYSVIFNGIGQSNLRGADRDTFQLAYTDGALNESFAIEPFGMLRSSLLDDIDLMQLADDKVLLMKTNVYHDGDQTRTVRMGRFAYACFLMGWVPGQSYFKFGVDDFYTTAELEDFPVERQLAIGLPLGTYTLADDILQREFEHYSIYANLSESEKTISHGSTSVTIPSMDAMFLERTE
ncbi:putative glycoside hydrolase [Stieleria marina]|uniref:Calx-beta domain protein n=1 Tax=Stieleria marina TaxID=1930275 RepID=A0A517NR70_9BACT|nr:Calx-beta domain protein [Planctomycetes bacterium K23_9]